MKTKLMTNTDMGELQEEINNFIKDKKVIDIKFNSVGYDGVDYDAVLIMYDEKEKGGNKK